MTRAIALILLASAARAAGWIELAPVIAPRQEVAVAAANGKLYLIGGLSGSSVLSSVEELDPTTGRWRFVAPIPQGVHHAAAATIGDSIYVIGGYPTIAFNAHAAVFRYDALLDQWSSVASLPKARSALAAATIDGKIYAVGGVPGGTDLTVYDPATNEWTTLASMPTPREHLAAAALHGALYVIGGRFGSSGNTNAFERFDPISGTWTSLPSMPTARSGLAAAVLEDRVYVFGGEGNPASVTGTFSADGIVRRCHVDVAKRAVNAAAAARHRCRGDRQAHSHSRRRSDPGIQHDEHARCVLRRWIAETSGAVSGIYFLSFFGFFVSLRRELLPLAMSSSFCRTS